MKRAFRMEFSERVALNQLEKKGKEKKKRKENAIAGNRTRA